MTVARPVLDGNGITYSVQPGTGFCDPGYLAATGSVHTGSDWNDTRGGNSDFGAPVFAIADGEVVHAEWHQVWGNIILIHHPALGVWSQYAHCNEMRVHVGQQVSLGDQIGTIGRGAGNRYIAHLHFEIRRVDLPPGCWPSSTMPPQRAEEWIRARYYNPVTWLEGQNALRTLAQVQEYRHPVAPVHAAPVAATGRVVLSQGGQPFQDISGARVEIKNAGSVVINATDPAKIQVRVD